MASLTPYEAADATQGTWTSRPKAGTLGPFCIDTRMLRHGDVFVALKTAQRDGHAFLSVAAQRGAMAALVEKTDPTCSLPQLAVADSLLGLQQLGRAARERFAGCVIGVTGSHGKTTVKEMLGQILGQQWFKNRGNQNNHIGVPLSLLQLDPAMHAGAVLEAGINHVGEMSVLADLIQPQAAVITSIGPAHLEGLGDIEGVAQEKSELARHLPVDGRVFAPADVLQYPPFRHLVPRQQLHLVHEDSGEPLPTDWLDLPNVYFYHYNWTQKTGASGSGELMLTAPGLTRSVSFAGPVSRGQLSNLALAIVVAEFCGVPETTIAARLEDWEPPQGRGKLLNAGQWNFYVDCYNANPVSMCDGAERFRQHFGQAKPALYILGGMNELGTQAAQWHRHTAVRLQLPKNARVVVLGPHAEAMREGFIETGLAADQIVIAADHAEAREQLDAFAGPVFLKGSRAFQLEKLIPREVDLYADLPC